MSISATSGTSGIENIAARLQQLADLRQQQVQIDLEVGESTRRARAQAVDQAMQDTQKQAELVNEIKRTAIQLRSGGGIDVWA